MSDAGIILTDDQIKIRISAMAKEKFREGQSAQNDGCEYGSAYNLYRHATLLQPENSEYQLKAGIMAAAIGKSEYAVEHFARAIHHADNKAEILEIGIDEYINDQLSGDDIIVRPDERGAIIAGLEIIFATTIAKQQSLVQSDTTLSMGMGQ